MSSTNRGYDRHKADYYVTPKYVVEEFLKEFKKFETIEGNILDPCCGGSEKDPATYVEVLKDNCTDCIIHSVDIREDSKSDAILDFLEYDFGNKWKPNVIISNPPFYLAKEFIEKSLNLVNEGGFVIMLLRLNFFGSKARRPFFKNNMPKYCFIHHKRISFIPDWVNKERLEKGEKKLTADSIEYAHFVWQKGRSSNITETILI